MGAATLASTTLPVTPPRPRTPPRSRVTRSSGPGMSPYIDMNAASHGEHHDRCALPPERLRALFLGKQYRQCVQACQQHLLARPDLEQQAPLHYAFICSYLAMAHEETARMMDDTADVKVATFDQAEKCYCDAMSVLPTCIADAASAFALRCPSNETGSTRDDDGELVFRQRPSSPIDDSTLRSFPMPGSTPGGGASPQTHIHDSDFPDFFDAESPSSFGDLMTPTRVLDRDFSRRSLIATPTKHFHHARPRSFCDESSPGLPRTTSNMSIFPKSRQQGLQTTTSHSLLRPVRLGSPAKPYAEHQPGKPNLRARASRLPKLVTSHRARPLGGVCETISENDPISPLGPADLTTASTLSPVSSVSSFSSDLSGPYEPDQLMDFTFVTDLEAMHVQLITHLRILDKVREESIEAQNRSGAAQDTGDRSTTPAPLPVGQNRHIRTTGSRAAYEQNDILTGREDKQKRILAGRERNWRRARFDPRRYVILAEKALAEL